MIRIVSFDVYDTLIKRIIPVKRLYGIMQEKLDDMQIVKIDDFAYRREKAESVLKRQGVNYSLSDIYHSACFEGYDENQKRYLIEMEEELEINNTVPAYYGQQLYRRFSEMYDVICISDMYLSEEVIRKILDKNGYAVSRLYISCEYRKSKRHKELYQTVLNDLAISGRELLHIGDAKRSDYINPKILGTKSCLVKKIDELIKTEDYYFDFGFNILGPVIYEFSLWIHENSHDGNLLFLSREGEFLQEIYKLLFHDTIEVLYLSRVSLIRGTVYILLQHERLEEIISLISGMGLEREVTLKNLFRRVGVSIEKYETQMIEMHLNYDSIISRRKGESWEIDTQGYTFMQNIKQILSDELKEKNILFDQYIRNMLNTSGTVVDIGWRGTMQNILEKYIKAKEYPIRLKGLYLGILDPEKNRKGFLFEGENKTSRSVLNFSGLLEIMLMPEHGSVIGYTMDEKEAHIIPDFDVLEFDGDSYKKIRSVQNGIKELIKILAMYDKKVCFEHSRIFNKLIKIGTNPDKQDIDMFSSLHFYENGESAPLIKEFALSDIFNFELVKKEFMSCKWKAAFFKKVFKINLPYNEVLNVGRMIFNERSNK